MSGPESPDVYKESSRARIDRALWMLRELDLRELLLACAPSAAIASLVIALYFLERVEGVRSLRPLFAVLFAAGFVLRNVVLSRWAGRRVEHILKSQGIASEHGSTEAIVRACGWLAIDVWLWLWLIVLMVRVDPWLVALVLPSFCMRAALAPSFFASADGSNEQSGFALLRRAVEESDGQRMTAVVCELWLLLGALGLAFNLGACLIAVVGLGQDMLGLDLGFVRAFLSPKNYFALLIVTSISLVLVEPVRAMLSALLYVDTRLSRDGLGIRILLSRCREEGRGRLGRAMLALMLCLSLSGQASAQDGELETAEEPSIPTCDEGCQKAQDTDADVTLRVEQILQKPIFAEFPDERWNTKSQSIEGLVERFLRWLESLTRDKQKDVERPSALSLPGAKFFVAIALLVLLVALVIWWRSDKKTEPEPAPEPEVVDPLKRSPEHHLALAVDARYSDLAAALRSLYLATLVGLSRSGRITLSPERTNGQYLDELKGTEERPLFLALTKTFDLVYYGRREPSQEDFDHCLSLARKLAAPLVPR